MSRLSRLPSLRPVGCHHTAASLTNSPLFDVKTVKTSVLTTCRLPTYSCKFDKLHPCLMSRLSRLPSLRLCRLPTYSCKFDKIHPCLMSRLSRLPSLRPVGCQHTAASLTNSPLFDVKTVKTSVLTTCRLPTYSCKFDKNTPVWCQTVKTSVLTTCRLPTYSCKFDKFTPVWCQDCQDFRPYDL